MKLQSYDELKHSKYRLSLMLFLFLNVAVSLFCLLPFLGTDSPVSSLPVGIVAAFSLTLLTVCLMMPKRKLPLLNPVAMILGALWAWHINHRYHQVFILMAAF